MYGVYDKSTVFLFLTGEGNSQQVDAFIETANYTVYTQQSTIGAVKRFRVILFVLITDPWRSTEETRKCLFRNPMIMD